jgi:hypothetical protein
MCQNSVTLTVNRLDRPPLSTFFPAKDPEISAIGMVNDRPTRNAPVRSARAKVKQVMGREKHGILTSAVKLSTVLPPFEKGGRGGFSAAI